MTRPHMIDRSHRYEGPLPDPRAVPDDREPSRFHVALGIVAVLFIGLALVGSLL